MKKNIIFLFLFASFLAKSQTDILVIYNDTWGVEGAFECLQNYASSAGSTANFALCPMSVANPPNTSVSLPACVSSMDSYDMVFVAATFAHLDSTFLDSLTAYMQNGGSLYIQYESFDTINMNYMESNINELLMAVGQSNITLSFADFFVFPLALTGGGTGIGSYTPSIVSVDYQNGNYLEGPALDNACITFGGPLQNTTPDIIMAFWETGYGGTLGVGTENYSSGNHANFDACGAGAGVNVWNVMSTPLICISCDAKVDITKDTIEIVTGNSDTIHTIYSSEGNIVWSPSIGLNNDTIKTPIITPTTSGWYSVSFEDSLDCSATDSVYVLLVPCSAEVNILQDSSVILEGTQLLIETNYSDTSTNVVWTPGDGVSNVNDLQPIIRPQKSMYYFVEYVDLFGCTSVDSIFIRLVPQCVSKIPTAFTPNGDGVNDNWEINCIHEEVNASIKVYNRWGALVYDSKGGEEYVPWDGSSENGGDLPTGSYYYILDGWSNESVSKSGTITLIK